MAFAITLNLFKINMRSFSTTNYLSLSPNFWSGEGLLSHDKVKVIKQNLITIGCCLFEHFLQLICWHGFSELFGNSAQIMNINCRGSVIVKQASWLFNKNWCRLGFTLINEIKTDYWKARAWLTSLNLIIDEKYN